MTASQVSAGLLPLLRCPETHQRLKPAEPALIEKLNGQIAAGQLRNRAGQLVNEQLDGALLRDDGRWVYAIRQGIPIMLVDEGLPVD